MSYVKVTIRIKHDTSIPRALDIFVSHGVECGVLTSTARTAASPTATNEKARSYNSQWHRQRLSIRIRQEHPVSFLEFWGSLKSARGAQIQLACGRVEQRMNLEQGQPRSTGQGLRPAKMVFFFLFCLGMERMEPSSLHHRTRSSILPLYHPLFPPLPALFSNLLAIPATVISSPQASGEALHSTGLFHPPSWKTWSSDPEAVCVGYQTRQPVPGPSPGC